MSVDCWRFRFRRLRKLMTIFTHVNGEQLFEGCFLLHAINWSSILLLPVRIVYRACSFLIRILFGRIEINLHGVVDFNALLFILFIRFYSHSFSFFKILSILSFAKKPSPRVECEIFIMITFRIPWALVEYSNKVFHVTFRVLLYFFKEMRLTSHEHVFPFFLLWSLEHNRLQSFLTQPSHL